MTINNIGNAFLVPSGESEKRSPDNYPAYGEKSAVPAGFLEDKISISSKEADIKAKKKNDEPQQESPDNYPSYGDKTKTTENSKEADRAPIVIYEPPVCDGKCILVESPDNYPSYGDK